MFIDQLSVDARGRLVLLLRMLNFLLLPNADVSYMVHEVRNAKLAVSTIRIKCARNIVINRQCFFHWTSLFS